MWRINSVEEITTTTTESFSEPEDDDNDDYCRQFGSNAINTPLKVPFPEAGIDLIDTNTDGFEVTEELLKESAVKWFDLQNWEENWLFKKRKRNDSQSDTMYGYWAMILAELPVYMLIPNSDHQLMASVGDRQADQLSELSEHNSVGSLEFSEDESDCESDVFDGVNGEEILSHKNNDCNESPINKEFFKVKDIRNNGSNDAKLLRTNVKPNVKLVTKVPKFMPKELRSNETQDNSDPYLVLRPGDASVQSGITVQFCCRGKGTKPLLFSWFKDDTLLRSDENYRIFQSGEQNVFEIKKTSADYSGQYSCVVYNSVGYQWSDFALEVKQQSFRSNKMPTNLRRYLKSKTVSDCEGIEITNNPKHEKHKTRPIVIQRTWAERVAELHIINSKSKAQKNNEMLENIDEESDKEYETNISETSTHPMSLPIAEREHKKWQTSDIELIDSPYSSENLNTRIQNQTLISCLAEELSHEINGNHCEEEDDEEDETGDTSFLSSKSKDFSRFERDFYVKEKLKRDDSFRSSQENGYSIDIQRKSSEVMSQISDISIDKSSNQTESDVILTDSESLLPSVKDLVNRFSSDDKQNDIIPKLDDIKRKNSFSETKINGLNKNMTTNHQNFKVHSLTARSLTKEFREMSQINLPRTQRNRMGINGQNRPNGLIESESSSPSTTNCSPTNEGYASDESNTSGIVYNGGQYSVVLNINNNNNNCNNNRKPNQSILKRASYWQKRCEQGLISDNTVDEEFPPMDRIAD